MIGHYLLFGGNCAQALDVYQQAFGATVQEMQKYGDMPPNPAFPLAESDRDLVLHARLAFAGMELMCADSKDRITPGDNMYVSLTTHEEALVQKAWALLALGGKVYMPLAPSFFAKQHGSLQDRFGINWMFTLLA